MRRVERRVGHRIELEDGNHAGTESVKLAAIDVDHIARQVAHSQQWFGTTRAYLDAFGNRARRWVMIPFLFLWLASLLLLMLPLVLVWWNVAS